MRTNKSLLAWIIPAGLAITTAVHAEGRFPGNLRAVGPVPHAVNGPVATAGYAAAPRLARASYPYRDAYGIAGYWEWDGYRHGWRSVPRFAPSPYHVPVFNRDGWFMGWDDMSGDVPRPNVEALRQNYRSQRD
ncbi:MAG: hypothetical protein IT529_15000 [Burkholderiales bacterium]|nr:hypothetical protein [Burkholderiales bacterium]